MVGLFGYSLMPSSYVRFTRGLTLVDTVLVEALGLPPLRLLSTDFPPLFWLSTVLHVERVERRQIIPFATSSREGFVDVVVSTLIW